MRPLLCQYGACAAVNGPSSDAAGAAAPPAGIRESNEKHIRVASRTTLERVQQRPPGPSLCRWGGYWVEVPRTRTVVETYTATVYALQPEEIQNHFTGRGQGREVEGRGRAEDMHVKTGIGCTVRCSVA